jgi:hypothetical protein
MAVTFVHVATQVFGLSGKQLAARTVHVLDIADDAACDMTGCGPTADPKRANVRALPAHRSSLRMGWADQDIGTAPAAGSATGPAADRMCTVHVLLTAECSLWGVGGRVEAYAAHALTEIWLRLHRMAYCWADDWLPSAAAAEAGRSAITVDKAAYERAVATELKDALSVLREPPAPPLTVQVPVSATGIRSKL